MQSLFRLVGVGTSFSAKSARYSDSLHGIDVLSFAGRQFSVGGAAPGLYWRLNLQPVARQEISPGRQRPAYLFHIEDISSTKGALSSRLRGRPAGLVEQLPYLRQSRSHVGAQHCTPRHASSRIAGVNQKTRGSHVNSRLSVFRRREPPPTKSARHLGSKKFPERSVVGRIRRLLSRRLG
jgi:hypothetical protein